MTEARQGAVFLDRDGVLSVEGGEYVTSADKLRLLPGAGAAVARLNAAGWRVFVFTNQAGVGRGCLTQQALDEIHARLQQQIAQNGGEITAIYACPHTPEEDCDCRKPRPGMLFEATREHDIDLTQSYAIGDTSRDIAAGKTAGCRAILVLSGHTHTYDSATFPDPQPDRVFADLPAAAQWLAGQRNTGNGQD